MPSTDRLQLADACESLRVMELLGRPLSRMADAVWEATHLAREAAFEAERDARSARPGLVSVPTSDTHPIFKNRAAGIAKATSAALLENLRALDPTQAAARLAKLRQAVGFSARAMGSLGLVDANADCLMVTLTYRGDNDDWSPLHITACLKALRQWLHRRGLAMRYVWVAELQKRGVIHYHVALWVPKGFEIPFPDSAGWWPHGMSNVVRARSAVAYLMKYLSKGSDISRHRLPHGARAYGVGGLTETGRLARKWLRMPGFIRARCDVAGVAKWTRHKGGGWADALGKVWPSEFVRSWVGDRYAVLKVLDHGRPFVADGPFSWMPDHA